LKKVEIEKKYDILFLLSGPEPQREYLEQIIIKEFANRSLKTLLVRGVIENGKNKYRTGHIKTVNYLLRDKLEKVINESELVVSRSGYTTIMDLAVLGKKAFFIPTPGQYEQEYLAKRLSSKGIVPYSKQKYFCYDKLNEVSLFRGFQGLETNNDFEDLFSLFEGK
jgi:UDP-N-acetylglucosamine transferase subunit ALG13